MGATRSIPFGRPMIGRAEISGAVAALESGVLVHGPSTAELERQFASWVGAEDAVAVSNCTAGLHLTLMCLGIGEGDEVAVPAMSHVATAHAVEVLGARPRFVDVSRRTGNMDLGHLEAVATESLSAIAPVHYLGLPCAMPVVLEIADRCGAAVVEDCALAVGATIDGRHVGTWGNAGAFSFYPTKHLSTIEGGMVVTNDLELARQLRKRRAFGYTKSIDQRSRPGHYDVDALGINYRMNEVEAAVGLVQLGRVTEFLEARARNFATLGDAAAQVAWLTVFPDADGSALSSHYCFNLVLPEDSSVDRDLVQDEFTRAGIGTSIHYPQALPLSAYYREKYHYRTGEFPVAEWLARSTISLPVGPHVTNEDAQYMAETLVSIMKRVAS